MRQAAGLKLARLLSMREKDFARLVREAEEDPLFVRLLRSGVVSRTPFPRAYFTARRLAGRELAAPVQGLGELLDGRSDLVRLMKKAGRERFEECFLREEGMSDEERGRRCGLSAPQARRLREFLDRITIRCDFERPASAPPKTFSAVAGIGIEKGEPHLSFFHRDIWKGSYRVAADRLAEQRASLPEAERGRMERLLRRLELLNRRKTTLYRALETLASAQSAYLKTGDPLQRQPLTQRSLATALGVDPSALNRLISNKSVELPWGTEAPMKALLPSAKALALERLAALVMERPGFSDEKLRVELASRHQIRLSRRSIAQYRKELGLPKSPNRGKRGGVCRDSGLS
ncbi:MAG: hypothetical protein AAB412_00920 [Elusimicrobiota bacterium]